MKNIIKIVMSLLVVFIGLASFASFGDYINPNLDVTEVRASHILVKTRPEAVKIRKEIVNGDISFDDAAENSIVNKAREKAQNVTNISQ